MSVARKSSGMITTYDPATRWAARAWALVAYLLVLAAVGGIVLFAVRYQPLSAANFASGPVAASTGKLVRVEYSSGGTLSFGFLLVNDGPLPAKIQRLRVTGENDLLIPVRFETAAKRDAGSLGVGDASLAKFIAFSLPAGEQRWVVVRTRFANCARFRPGDVQTFTRFRVTYSVLGFTKQAWVQLPKNIRVSSPPDAGCPART